MFFESMGIIVCNQPAGLEFYRFGRTGGEIAHIATVQLPNIGNDMLGKLYVMGDYLPPAENYEKTAYTEEGQIFFPAPSRLTNPFVVIACGPKGSRSKLGEKEEQRCPYEIRVPVGAVVKVFDSASTSTKQDGSTTPITTCQWAKPLFTLVPSPIIFRAFLDVHEENSSGRTARVSQELLPGQTLQAWAKPVLDAFSIARARQDRIMNETLDMLHSTFLARDNFRPNTHIERCTQVEPNDQGPVTLSNLHMLLNIMRPIPSPPERFCVLASAEFPKVIYWEDCCIAFYSVSNLDSVSTTVAELCFLRMVHTQVAITSQSHALSDHPQRGYPNTQPRSKSRTC